MKHCLENIDSMIFDLDGTLWDATEEIAKAWSSILPKYNTGKKEITKDELKGYMGLPLDDIIEKMFKDMDKEEVKALVKECCEFQNEHLKNNGATLYDKIEDTLKELSKKYKLFIVSNCEDGYIESFLEFYNFDKYFQDFECPGRSNLLKAENIGLVIKRNNLKNPIYVGDTHMDSEAAKKAGIPFIFANYGFGNTNEYTSKIEKFEELLNL